MHGNNTKLIKSGALIALAGYILSGPAALLAVMRFHPQPPWTSARVFVEHYHPVQDLPFYFGFLLIGGMLVLMTGHYLRTTATADRGRPLLALLLTTVFCTLICFNYIVQTTFVRNLTLHYQPENDGLIAAFSMSNPLSLCWANEMWGYAVLGVATWLLAPYYRERNRTTSALLALNGWMSLAGALLSALDIGWVMTPAGLIAYSAWNLLMMVLMVLIYRDDKSRCHAAGIWPGISHGFD